MIQIRHARPEDVAAIAAVHLRANLETYRPLLGPRYEPPDEAERRALWAEALKAGGPLYVALEGTRIVGFAHAVGDRLTTLYLLRSHHRMGIGRRLLAAILEAAAVRGVDRLQFDVLAQNLAAIAFYQAMGACPTGEVIAIDWEFGRTEDLVFSLATGVAPSGQDE